ncbi:MAG: single-stranded-DNA-specific exonuclease RecJ [Rhodospirillaceae bacterium]|jgi:single-stranded-DNA-specific exonuclease|nr:single-stranded-DNA-specific exonuclease RecJ [Rhodospirillaceae bacterium]
MNQPVAAVPVDEGKALLGVTQSLSGRVWRQRAADDRVALALSQRLGVPDIVGRVLAGRDVGIDDGEGFLNPTLKSALPDPSCLRDMDKAAGRLADAVTGGEQVAVFGDYDVDGATSSALLHRYFRAIGVGLEVYIPDRQKEGYGPNAPALLELQKRGASVVVTVDCGIAAFEPLQAAADAGLDMIIVDHHQAEPRLPTAHAVVNPNRLDDDSGLGQLAAVGVSFLLVVALNRALRQRGWFAERSEPNLLQWLDLVALGTVCDVVPLTGLNRVLVAQGLKIAAGRNNPGLAALSDLAKVDQRPGTYHLGFVFGPRLNASGRVGNSHLGSRLLATDDLDEAQAIAAKLNEYNLERREIEAAIQTQAVDHVESHGGGQQPLLFLSDPRWHQGVIGIVASRLKDRFRRPTIVIAIDGDIGKGSGRSVPGVDLGAAVTAAKQAGLLLAGGGHAMAAGLTVAVDKLGELEDFLTARIGQAMAGQPQRHEISLDGALAVSGATRDLFETLEGAGPFGAGHPEPRFAIDNAEVIKADLVGQNHVRMVLAGARGGRLKGIAFGVADSPLGQALLSSRGRALHLAGHLRADDWQGRRGVQLFIEDAALPENQ